MTYDFPDIYIQMNDEERKRFAGQALRMFDELLEFPGLANTISSPGSSHLSARIVNLARYLVKFHPGPRRSVSTQTDDAPRKQLWSQ